jgi:hypothetical protein
MATATEQEALQILETFGIKAFDKTVVPVVETQIIMNPTITDTTLVSEDDGTVKHLLRKEISWGVDIIWPFIVPYVTVAVTNAIATARAALGIPDPTSAV